MNQQTQGRRRRETTWRRPSSKAWRRARRYVEPTLARVIRSSTPLLDRAGGEPARPAAVRGVVQLRSARADGTAWGQARRDGYVGFVDESALSTDQRAPTHRVGVLRTFGFESPSIKSPSVGHLSLNALLDIVDESGSTGPGGRLRLGRRCSTSRRSGHSPQTPPPSPNSSWARRICGADATAWAWIARGWCSRRSTPAGRPARATAISRRCWVATLAADALRRGDLVFWRRPCRHDARRRAADPRQRPPHGGGDRTARAGRIVASVAAEGRRPISLPTSLDVARRARA